MSLDLRLSKLYFLVPCPSNYVTDYSYRLNIAVAYDF